MADEHKDIDPLTGTATTGHDWDGIHELNTPLPRWWLWTFYLTIIWAIGYWVVYPAWPLLTDVDPRHLRPGMRAVPSRPTSMSSRCCAGR